MHKVFMGKRGTKLTVIDWALVQRLAAIQCTGVEIASALNIDYKTLERACKREQHIKLGEWIGAKRGSGKVSLRRHQWKSVESGNVAMQIWLGKNWLGQKDKSDDEIEAMKQPEPIVIVRATKQ